MTTFYVPKIAPEHYEAFRSLLKSELPGTYQEWLHRVQEEITDSKGQGLVAESVPIDLNEFTEFCSAAQTQCDLATLKRLAFQKGARHKG